MTENHGADGSVLGDFGQRADGVANGRDRVDQRRVVGGFHHISAGQTATFAWRDSGVAQNLAAEGCGTHLHAVEEGVARVRVGERVGDGVTAVRRRRAGDGNGHVGVRAGVAEDFARLVLAGGERGGMLVVLVAVRIQRLFPAGLRRHHDHVAAFREVGEAVVASGVRHIGVHDGGTFLQGHGPARQTGIAAHAAIRVQVVLDLAADAAGAGRAL